MKETGKHHSDFSLSTLGLCYNKYLFLSWIPSLLNYSSQFVSKLSYPILKNENLVDEQNNVLDSTASQVWHLSVPFYSKILQNCYDCLYALFYFLLNPLAIIHSNLAALRALIASLYPCTLVSNFLVITYSGSGLDLDLLLLIRCGGDNEVPMCSQVFRIPCAFLPFFLEPCHHSKTNQDCPLGGSETLQKLWWVIISGEAILEQPTPKIPHWLHELT